jgi:hypothetical protein
MIRRWLIRGLLLTLLTLCVTAWVTSYSQGIGIVYSGNSQVSVLGEGKGEAVLDLEFMTPSVGAGPGWEVGHSADPDTGFANAQYHFLGFGFAKSVAIAAGGTQVSRWTVWIPLWFPTLLTALLLWFVWRKTRAKPRGFPVEVVKSGEQQT